MRFIGPLIIYKEVTEDTILKKELKEKEKLSMSGAFLMLGLVSISSVLGSLWKSL